MDKSIVIDTIAESNLQIIQEADIHNPSRPIIKFRGVLSTAEVKNGNGRIYDLATLEERILNARCSSDHLTRVPLLGEKLHPKNELTGEIDFEKATHKLNWAKLEGNNLIGEIQLLPETAPGKVLYELVKNHGVVPNISSRALGSMNGDYVNKDDYKFITYDLTTNPSNPGSFLKAFQESVELQSIIKECNEKDAKSLTESFGVELGSLQLLVDTVSAQDSKIINEVNINKTKINMDNLEKLTEEISSLSEKVGNYKRENATLSESNESLKEKYEALVNEHSETQTQYNKLFKVLEGLRSKYYDLKESSQIANSKNEDSSIVVEGLREELDIISANYEKSLRFVESIHNQNKAQAIKALVEKELGSWDKYSKVFNGLDSMSKVQDMVSVMKENNEESPTKSLLTEKKEIGSESVVDDMHAKRIEMYS